MLSPCAYFDSLLLVSFILGSFTLVAPPFVPSLLVSYLIVSAFLCPCSLLLPPLFTHFLLPSPWFPAPSRNPTGVRSESTDTDTLLITWDVSNVEDRLAP